MSLHLEISQGIRVDNLQELQNKVRLRGGRLVVHLEVLSAVIFSAQSYKVRWVAPGVGHVKASAISTLITVLFGWWSLSGIYRSITALIWNFRGGVDVTEALLNAHPGNTSLLGHSDLVALNAFHEKASRLSRWICVGLVALLVIGFSYLIRSVPKR